MNTMDAGTQRPLLLRWIGWTYVIHIMLFAAIELTYLYFINEQGTVFNAGAGNFLFAWSFLAASYIAHGAAICFFCLLPALLTALVLPRRLPVIIVGGFFSGMAIFALLLDRLAYQTFQMHQFTELLRIFASGTLLKIIPLSLPEVLVVASLVCIAVIVEIAAGSLLFRIIPAMDRAVRVIAPAIALMTVYSYGMMAAVTTLPERYRPAETNCDFVYKYSRMVPYYPDLFFAVVPGGEKNVRHIRTNPHRIPIQTGQAVRELRYPLSKLVFEGAGGNPNILFILIDMWRHDAFRPDITPSIADFSGNALRFRNHRSGGNCTKPGIFSLFYSLPGNYWDAMAARGRGPLFIAECVRRNYECAVFSSATLEYPEFNKTVFIDVPGAERPRRGGSSVERDRENTEDFISFMKNRKGHRPLFAFLFFDGAHNYCEDRNRAEYLKPFEPAIRRCKRFEADQDRERPLYINRYHNALHFIDGQIGRVLRTVREKGMLGNSIIIITSDHGVEFNEKGNGNRAYATSFSRYQLHVPLIVFWPGRGSAEFDHGTTHLDLVPTLMRDAFGCTSPAAHYACGHSLFSTARRPYLVAGSYCNYAIVTGAWTMKIFPNGDYLILDPRDRSIPPSKEQAPVLFDAFEELNRYYR